VNVLAEAYIYLHPPIFVGCLSGQGRCDFNYSPIVKKNTITLVV